MGQFDHENAKAFRDTLTRLLKGIFNPTSTGKGISELIETALNAGNSVRATRVVTPEDVLSESKDEAESNTPPTIPTITLRPNAIEEANSRNVTYQSIIGAKEGATEIIKRVVGSDIVDAKRLPRSNDEEWGEQTGKHCIKLGRKKPHPFYPESKCFYNKKWKGYHPEWACELLGVDYRQRKEFPANLGRPRDAGDSSDTGSDD